jgi:hypothetical protein
VLVCADGRPEEEKMATGYVPGVGEQEMEAASGFRVFVQAFKSRGLSMALDVTVPG